MLICLRVVKFKSIHLLQHKILQGFANRLILILFILKN